MKKSNMPTINLFCEVDQRSPESSRGAWSPRCRAQRAGPGIVGRSRSPIGRVRKPQSVTVLPVPLLPRLTQVMR